MERTKIYFDTEFTGLHKNTTLISIGLVSETGKTFYAELSDYDHSQIDDWLEENVMKHLKFPLVKTAIPKTPVTAADNYSFKGTTAELKELLTQWLEQFGEVEMWSDCLSYDWVLFNHIFGDAMSIPENVYYIPFDICTLFKIKNIDPDISREEFAGVEDSSEKHESLFDAKVVKMCYDRLMGM